MSNQIVAPHEHDVLSGRGNFVNYHAGNEHFRALVRKHKVAYVACPKPQKGQFSKMIVDEIKNLNPPGRFLKQDSSTKLWYDIGEKKALDKTRQALREGAPDIMKELTPEDEGYEGGSDGLQQQQEGVQASQVRVRVANRALMSLVFDFTVFLILLFLFFSSHCQCPTTEILNLQGCKRLAPRRTA
jgi:hypothetical protein